MQLESVDRAGFIWSPERMSERVLRFVAHEWEDTSIPAVIAARLRGLYRTNFDRILLPDFNLPSIARVVETEFAGLLTVRIALKVLPAIERLYYGALRYAFLSCAADLGKSSDYQYVLKCQPGAAMRCQRFERGNPYCFEDALKQNESHGACGCVWAVESKIVPDALRVVPWASCALM